MGLQRLVFAALLLLLVLAGLPAAGRSAAPSVAGNVECSGFHPEACTYEEEEGRWYCWNICLVRTSPGPGWVHVQW